MSPHAEPRTHASSYAELLGALRGRIIDMEVASRDSDGASTGQW
jgi:hypothetical protein